MKLGQLFQRLQIAIRSRWRLVVLFFITLLFCIFVFPKIARPAVTPESHLPGLSLEQWRSQSPISRRSQDSPSPEELLQKAHELQIEGYYRNSCKLLLKALGMNLSDTKFEKLIRDEYPDADVEQEVQKLFPVEPETPFRAKTLRRLGDVLRTMGSLKPSSIVLMQSLEIAEQFADSEETSAIHFSLGNTYRALGKRAQIIQETEAQKKEQKEINDRQALDHYERAIARSTSESLKLRAKLSKLNLLVEIKLDNNVISLANEVKSTLESLEESLEPNLETVYARLDLAQSLTCLNVKHTRTEFEYPQPPIINFCTSDSTDRISSIDDEDLPKWDEIVQLLVTAEQQAEDLEDVRSQSYALGNLGEVYEISQQYSEALEITKQALNSAKFLEPNDIAYRWYWQLGRLNLKQGKKFDTLNSYTAAFYSLQSLRQDLVALNSDSQFNFRDEVEPVYRQFVEVLLKPEAGDLQPSQNNLRQARQVISALQVAELDDFFKQACVDVTSSQIDEIVDNSETLTAAIYPIILKDKISVILKLPHNPDLLYQSILVENSKIEKTLNEFLTQLRSGSEENMQPLGEKVYDWIFRDLDKNLKNKKIEKLIFVPDVLLRNIPMAALYDGQQYLIEHYSVSLALSPQLKASEDTATRFKILGAGFSEAQNIEGQDYTAIPYVKTEIEKLKQDLSATVLMDESFNYDNFKNLLNSTPFSIVHIATHGKFSSNSEQTYIVISGQRLNVNSFGSLIRQSSIKHSQDLDLLVLSACETATGDNRATLGIAGIAVKAGVRNTIATLWQATDRTAQRLFEEFYRQLKENPNLSKTEALQQAQITLLDNGSSVYGIFPFVIVENFTLADPSKSNTKD